MRSLEFADHEEVSEGLDNIRENGFPVGLSTGYTNLDEYFTLAPSGTLNCVSGYPSSGKSEFIDNIACHMALKHKWDIVIYSPESYPPDHHALGLIEKITGRTAFNRGIHKAMPDKDFFKGEYVYKSRFSVISAEDDAYTFEEILNGIDEMCNHKKVDMVILDPFNELENGRPSGMSETDYIGLCLMKARRLARKRNISFWIVAHPAKPAKKSADGTYPVPDLYDLSGSAHWRNKIDYGLIVHRYTLEDTKVSVFVKKIKKRFYGKIGEVLFNFVPSCGRYAPAKEEL